MGNYPLFELTSSGMTHINEVYAKATNDYRIAGPYVGLNFGLIEVDWNAKPYPLIILQAVGEDGSTGFTHTLRLDELQPGKRTGDQTLTLCPEPRPEICTREYRPVCAQLQNGGFKTYANGCTACTDTTVTGYREGACE